MVTDDDKAEVLTALKTALRRFGQGPGVEASNLQAFMQGQGKILLFALGVASNTPNDQFKSSVAEVLESHITRLPIPPGRKVPNAERHFRNLARMHFGTLDDPRSVQGRLEDRRVWFAGW